MVAGIMMPLTEDAVLGVRTLFDGWFKLLSLRLRLNGNELDRAIVDHPSGSAILAYDPDRRVAVTVRQTRAGPLFKGHPALVEAVAGVVEGEDYAECARREMLEETGVRLASIEPVAQVWITPSSTTERVHLFLGTYGLADRVAPGGGLPEEHEHLVVEEVPLAQLWESVARGDMIDAKTLMLVQALRIRHPALFKQPEPAL